MYSTYRDSTVKVTWVLHRVVLQVCTSNRIYPTMIYHTRTNKNNTLYSGVVTKSKLSSSLIVMTYLVRKYTPKLHQKRIRTNIELVNFASIYLDMNG